MALISEVYSFIDEFAPFSTAMEWDNCGLLVRAEQKRAEKILLALDITVPVAEEARKLGAGLVVSHHPVIFAPIRRICCEDPVYRLVRYGISAICAHTNLDLARGGVNDCLAHRLQLRDVEPLGPVDDNMLSLGRIGTLSVPAPAEIALQFVRKNLGTGGLRYVPGPEIITRVAVGGGACAELLPRAAELHADLFLTSDVKHHELLLAQALGIALVDAGHYCTERVVLEPLAQRLRERFPDTEILLSAVEADPVRYLE